METVNSVQINTLELRLKPFVNARGERYLDVLSDGNYVTFSLGPMYLKTERGMYSEFVLPNDCLETSLTDVSNLCDKHGNPVKGNKTSYLDIVLDTNVPEQRAIVKSMRDFTKIIRDKLIDSFLNCNSEVNKHVNKFLDNIDDELNFMYLKNNNVKSNIVFLHLRVDRNTVTYDENDNIIDTDILCYKRYKVCPVVKIDNIRIPRNCNENNRINIHLYVIRQVVIEYTNKFEE